MGESKGCRICRMRNVGCSPRRKRIRRLWRRSLSSLWSIALRGGLACHFKGLLEHLGYAVFAFLRDGQPSVGCWWTTLIMDTKKRAPIEAPVSTYSFTSARKRRPITSIKSQPSRNGMASSLEKSDSTTVSQPSSPR